jgi:hypothetical protein
MGDNEGNEQGKLQEGKTYKAMDFRSATSLPGFRFQQSVSREQKKKRKKSQKSRFSNKSAQATGNVRKCMAIAKPDAIAIVPRPA